MQHPLPGPHHHNSFLYRVGLKPGIPAQEAGALPRRLKATASSVRFTHSPYWHTSVTLTPPTPHSRPGHGTNATPPPGPHHHNSFLFRAVSNPGFRTGGGRATKDAKGYSLYTLQALTGIHPLHLHIRGVCYSNRSSTVQQNDSNRTGHR